MGFSIIIPSANLHNLETCVRSIYRQEPRFSIIVVEDRMLESGELSKARLAVAMASEGRSSVLHGVIPFNFSRNVNLGIMEAGTDDVVLLNDDAVLIAGYMKWLVEAANQIQGIVSASIRGAVNNPDQLERRPPYPHFPRENKTRRLQKGYLAFICVAIPRFVIDQVGLLDERFTTYGGEDVDYCYRAQLAGVPLAVYDATVVDHGNILKSTFRRTGVPDIQPGLKLLKEKWEEAQEQRGVPLPL